MSKETCKDCSYYGLYKIITANKPYGYGGEIPCFRCSRYIKTKKRIFGDKFKIK